MGFSDVFKTVGTYKDSKSPIAKTLKIQEELGELAAEVLRDAGLKKGSLSEIRQRKRILEEGADVLIYSLVLLNEFGFSKGEIIQAMDNKIAYLSSKSNREGEIKV